MPPDLISRIIFCGRKNKYGVCPDECHSGTQQRKNPSLRTQSPSIALSTTARGYSNLDGTCSLLDNQGENLVDSSEMENRKKQVIQFYADAVKALVYGILNNRRDYMNTEQLKKHTHQAMRLVVRNVPVDGEEWCVYDHQGTVDKIVKEYLRSLSNIKGKKNR